MKIKQYEKKLESVFQQVKEEIKKNKKNIICIPNEEYDSRYIKFIIPEFENNPKIKIYEIPYRKLEFHKLIKTSGVYVLYFIVCLYLQLNGNKGVEFIYSSEKDCIKSLERTKILKSSSFIFRYEEKKFNYYPLNDIKGTGRFIFDLPPCI